MRGGVKRSGASGSRSGRRRGSGAERGESGRLAWTRRAGRENQGSPERGVRAGRGERTGGGGELCSREAPSAARRSRLLLSREAVAQPPSNCTGWETNSEDAMIRAWRPILCGLTRHLWDACPSHTLCATDSRASDSVGRIGTGLYGSAGAKVRAARHARWVLRANSGSPARVARRSTSRVVHLARAGNGYRGGSYDAALPGRPSEGAPTKMFVAAAAAVAAATIVVPASNAASGRC